MSPDRFEVHVGACHVQIGPRSSSADITGMVMPVRGARSLSRDVGSFVENVKGRPGLQAQHAQGARQSGNTVTDRHPSGAFAARATARCLHLTTKISPRAARPFALDRSARQRPAFAVQSLTFWSRIGRRDLPPPPGLCQREDKPTADFGTETALAQPDAQSVAPAFRHRPPAQPRHAAGP